MKNLVMIVHANAQQDLADLLRGLDRVGRFTFSHVEGHGAQADRDPLLSARDKVVGYTPRTRVEILLEDADVEFVLAAIRAQQQGIADHGIYWVTSVERQGRL